MMRFLTWLACAALCFAAPAAAAEGRTRIVANGASRIEVTTLGTGPLIVMLPSAGRGNEDFLPVARKLAANGFRVALPQPRGAGRSTGPTTNVTLQDLASDVAAVIRDEKAGPAVVMGHAFGNFVARMTATDHPELVRGVIIAAGGRKGVAGGKEDSQAAALRVAVETLNNPRSGREARLAALRLGFFAPGNDPRVWLAGWNRSVFDIQSMARSATPPEKWWMAGSAPVLEIQAAQDPFKPAASADELQKELGPRVTVVRIPDASHALFPEQPDKVVEAITRWMRSQKLSSLQAGARVPYADPAEMTPEQRAYHDALVADGIKVIGPRLNRTGPRMLLLHDEALTRAWASFGGQLNRADMLFPVRYRELAILAVARGTNSQFEWYAHEPLARKAGIPFAVIEAIKHGRTPQFENADEKAIYEFANELVRHRKVSDPVYRKVWDMLGTAGILNMTVLVGQYVSTAILLNAHGVRQPEGEPLPMPEL